jgi:hypothetical protein
MAIVPMADAVPGTVASSSEYNKIIDNVIDLDTRVSALTPGTKPNIERRQNASQAIAATTNTKVPFDTSINAGSAITYSGTTVRSFTFATSGVYTFSTSLRVDTTVGLYVWFAPTGTVTSDRGKNAASGGAQVGTSATFRITAGDAYSVWMWASGACNLVREGGTTGLAPWISIEYMGPL